MSRKFGACLLAVFVSLAAVSAVFSQVQVPAHTGYVNDLAGVIDPVTKQTLENRLKALHDSTEAQIEIAVLTVRTTGDRPIFDYSLAVAREWKIGSKEDDNPAVLLTVAIDDRKYFTQISRDAEGDIPDGLAGQIQRQYLVPAFKQSQYGKGIQDTVEAYIRRFGEIRGFDPATLQKAEPKPAATPYNYGGKTERSGGSAGICAICGCVIVIIVFIFIIFGAAGTSAARRSSWSGGSFGGGGRRKSGVASDIVETAVPMVIGGIIGSMLSGGGSGSSSSSSDWGSSSGGGSDWGGFGGGGDFGGGGAGGDW